MSFSLWEFFDHWKDKVLLDRLASDLHSGYQRIYYMEPSPLRDAFMLKKFKALAESHGLGRLYQKYTDKQLLKFISPDWEISPDDEVNLSIKRKLRGLRCQKQR